MVTRIRTLLLSVAIVLSVVSAVPEQVWLRDLNSDLERRNLESAGLPSTLRFELFRGNNDPGLELNLEENRRLNANAPVFDVEPTSNGKQRLVRKESATIKTTKFYQDKKNGGAFQVTCENQPGGACQRKLYGNFNMSGRSYELKPVPDAPSVPSLHGKRRQNSEDVPHVLVPSGEDEDRPRLNPSGAKVADFLEIPDRHRQLRKEFLEELKSFLSKKQREVIAKKLRRSSRRKRANELYAMEIVVAADPALWKKYYDTTSASGGLNRNDATELRLRQHFAHIINGISLRYESIEDPGMDIYVTLSGFIFYKTINSSNPLPPSTQIPNVNDVEYADADVYINSLTPWASSLENLPHNDHIAVFTGYELYSGGSTSNDGVAGKAWVGGVCNNYRTSINEDGSYFVTVSVAAHEIGHNMGASHDGSGTSASCGSDDKYLMAPMVTSFYPGQAYTVNPWRFSQCSIDAFKSYVSSMGSENCLLDHGDYYSASEYSSHVSLLPGQLHTPDEQCQLVRGDSSSLCSDAESEDICTTMLCKGDDNRCWYYAAARGTPCGPVSHNKWCIDGQCVAKSDSHTGGDYGSGSSNTGGTQVETETENTDQTTSGSTGCIDRGWEDWSCQMVSDYFLSTYGATPSQWCMDPTWNYNCCAYCSGSGQEAVTTTTTTTTTEAPVPPSSGDDCVDIGWSCASGTWSCQKVSDYFLSTYNYTPSSWCLDPNWKYRCCQFCAGYGI
ncbi:A disintegrin and metalloproteinase with thrombospondin motifs 16-like [Mercenaria mercenaria]|uniref:A disintegrin and metalloproteinase with thrombospondin motifs 16-like n=1 Tax=Mercenaria mercenaria TaxID=6596 RepID=UPI00234E8221|nr:A disintegrin and metalloproteinase with thrombospondin motifs 16-like [Mercenaria mercenaria]